MEEIVSLAKDIIEMLKPIAQGMKLFIDFLVSEPAVALLLGSMLLLVCVREALSRGAKAPFSVKTATIISLALTVYGAYTIAERLPFMGRLAAYAVIIGVPLSLIFRFLRGD